MPTHRFNWAAFRAFLDTVIGKSMNLYGEYCEWEIMCLEHIIEPSWHILDIGANIGTHTIPFSKMVYRGHVYAFEPQKMTYYGLCGGVALSNLKNG